MAAPVSRASWTRRVPGWAFLVFFLSLIVLTYLAVYYWNRGDLVTSGYLAAMASAVPLLLVVLVYYGLPVWALTVPLALDAAAGALAVATRDRTAEPVAERDGAFAKCVSVVRFNRPPCLVGVARIPSPRGGVPVTDRCLLLLRPEAGDRKAMVAFRELLARSLLGAPQGST